MNNQQYIYFRLFIISKIEIQLIQISKFYNKQQQQLSLDARNMDFPTIKKVLSENEYYKLTSQFNGKTYFLELSVAFADLKQIYCSSFDDFNLPTDLKPYFKSVSKLNMFLRRDKQCFQVFPDSGTIMLNVKQTDKTTVTLVPIRLEPIFNSPKQRSLCGKDKRSYEKQSLLQDHSQPVIIKEAGIGSSSQFVMNQIQATKTQIMSQIRKQEQRNSHHREYLSYMKKFLIVYQKERKEYNIKFEILEKQCQHLKYKLTDLENKFLLQGLVGRKKYKKQKCLSKHKHEKVHAPLIIESKFLKQNQSIKTNHSTIDKSFVNIGSAFLSNFDINQNSITYIGQDDQASHIFLSRQIKFNSLTQFQLKILKTKMMRLNFGIASTQYITCNDFSITQHQMCIFYRLSSGDFVQNSNFSLTKIQQKDYFDYNIKQGDTIKMTINPKKSLIQFSQDDKISECFLQNFNNKRYKWAFFIQMMNQGDCVQINSQIL